MSKVDTSKLTKLYYSIGEVAQLFEVNASLLRFWEKEFGFEISKKTKKGNRLFSVEEVEKINTIFQLVKVQGFTLEGAKNQLKRKNKTQHITMEEEVLPFNRDELIEQLSSIKKRLLKLKDK